ncbi:MAG: glycosyltransferase, partial [Paucibacter sp.]|nr:glycosyltransferase [Roseateles sp.]
MHVLYIPSWYPAKVGDTNGSFFREQAQAMSAAGTRVGVITPAFRSFSSIQALTSGSFGIHQENDLGVPTLRLHGVRAFSWNHALNMRFWEHKGIQAYENYACQHGKPDILHVHGMIYGLAWASAIKQKYGVPFVVTEHSSEFALANIRPKLLAYLQEQVQHASRLFAVSRDLGRRLTSTVTPPSHLAWNTMPNLVNTNFGSRVPNRKANPLPGRLNLLTVGVLQPKKGHAKLLLALKE